MDEIKIAVIDTDLDINCTQLNFDTINIDRRFWKERFVDNTYTKGHGTAVCGIIQKYAPYAKIILFPVSIYDDSGVLVDILTYIYESRICNIINLSLGFFRSGEKNKVLCKICQKLVAAGTIIVSAFDNHGFMSYPACIDEVIGVDTSKDVKGDDFIWIENSPINIVCSSEKKRVIWEGGHKVYVKGNSFSVPLIASIVANIFKTNGHKANVKDLLKQQAIKIHKLPIVIENDEKKININKAILFPINEDTLPIAVFQNDCNFRVAGMFDYKYSSRIGKKLSETFSYICDSDDYIKSVDRIRWDDNFDTIILGRFDNMQSSRKNDILSNLMCKAEKYNKIIYLLDDNIIDSIDQKKNIIIHPMSPMRQYPSFLLEKKWKNSVYTICVAGSGLDIDKLILQLQLKRMLSSDGYSVGYLSTHKSGILLGADQDFLYNKNQFELIKEKEKSLILNHLIHKIELNNPDIIITGMLSELIPSNSSLLNSTVIFQSTFLYTTQPDAIILVVSPDDEMEYIIRNINFIKVTIEREVICLAVSSIKTYYKNGLINTNKISESIDFLLFLKKLQNKTGIPTFELCEKNMTKLKNICLHHLLGVIG